MTLRELATHSALSLRMLSLVEAGTANPTLSSLEALAAALDVDVLSLLQRPAGARPVVLLGLRGAGKSTVGEGLAKRLGYRFIELDRLIEREGGLSLGAMFELHGEPHVRRLEARVVGSVLGHQEPAVIATGGGLVTSKETFDLLKRRAFTVWLKATPQEHWDRVRAQGDHRPMARRSAARAELDDLWHARAPLYAEAEIHVDTSALTVDEVVEVIAGAVARAPSDAPPFG